MPSQTLSLSGNSSELECYFFPPIEVGEKSEIGLLSLQTYNCMPNVEEGRNTLGVVKDSGETMLIVIPTGCYEIITLETKIRELLGSNVRFFNLIADNSTLKCVLNCSNDVKLDVENSIASLLGFKNRRTLEAELNHESDNVLKIMEVNCIKVECNLVSGSFDNGEQSHSIHEFYPAVPPGFKIVEIPKYCILYKLKTNTIDYVRISLKDQNDKLINFREETVNVRLLIKNGSEV